MNDKYSRRMSLQCSTCGGTEFRFEDETGPFRCVGCDRTFSREELMHENGSRIDSEIEEIGNEVLIDFRDALREAFKSSKHINFK